MMTEQTSPLTDPMVVRINRETVRGAVVRALTCPLSGVILDMRRAVLLTVKRDGQTIGAQVYDARTWDGAQGAAIRAELAKREGLTLATIDGREWWATDAQRSALAVVDAHGSAEVGRSTDLNGATVSRSAARALIALGLLAEYSEDSTTYVHRPVNVDRAPATNAGQEN